MSDQPSINDHGDTIVDHFTYEELSDLIVVTSASATILSRSDKGMSGRLSALAKKMIRMRGIAYE
jgi:hypothetical protein